MNSTFRERRLASSEVISQVLFTSEQPKKNKMAFVDTLSQIKLPFGPLVIQLVWYILYLLLTEFEVRTVSYGPSFFSFAYGPSAKRAGHKSTGKNEDP